MKVALIHDHLVQDGGAERVLKALKEIFPEAPIFTLVFDPKNTNRFFYSQDIRTSFLQKFPLGVRCYQWWLPIMPAAIESYDLTDYDLVISSASAFAKGVITKPGSRHLCYCYTPTRFLWIDTHSYIKELKVNPIFKIFLPLTLHRLRGWDRLAADRVDFFATSSATVRERIKKYYHRPSEVVYPPVDVDNFWISSAPKKYYLAGSRLVPYKKIDLVIQAFGRLGIPLKVFGVGPEMARLKKLAANSSKIEFLGKVSEEEKCRLYAEAIAYLHPQEEDFGITAIEAMAAGRPVIAYQAGGALETVIPGRTGEFFENQWWEEIADKVIRFRPEDYSSEEIKRWAENFRPEIFKNQIINLVNKIFQNENSR